MRGIGSGMVFSTEGYKPMHFITTRYIVGADSFRSSFTVDNHTPGRGSIPCAAKGMAGVNKFLGFGLRLEGIKTGKRFSLDLQMSLKIQSL